jgi:hypothetical protein
MFHILPLHSSPFSAKYSSKRSFANHQKLKRCKEMPLERQSIGPQTMETKKKVGRPKGKQKLVLERTDSSECNICYFD